jgi:RNA polymerase sigma-70 factor (ECF subfamily)
MDVRQINMPLQSDDPSVVAAASDAELARRIGDGTNGALEALYSRCGRDLHRLAFHLLGSIDEAEDVVQEVFVGLPLAMRHYEERGAFRSWLRRLTARTALMQLRQRARRSTESLDSPASRQHPSAPDLVLERIDLQAAISSLPDALRTVFVLSQVEQFSHAEISAMLGIRRGTSEVRLHRAIRRLRSLLEDRS